MENVVLFNDGNQPRNPHWHAMVKNTARGRKWITEFKEKNPQLRVKLRGRHHDRKFVYELAGKRYWHGTQNDIPLMYAERIAVYTESNPHRNYNIKPGQYLPMKGEPRYLKVVRCNSDYCTTENKFAKISVIFKWSHEKQMWKIYQVFA